MIYNNPDESISEYEETINKLTTQITDLFSKIHFYQALIAEKDLKITQLINENNTLKMQIRKLSNELKTPPPPSQKSYTPPQQPLPTLPPETPSKTTSVEKTTPSFTTGTDSRINKRQCPNCGAMGFAIREIDDKSNIISYVPRRIYAKKKSCTKCRYEW
ncbi:MAG: hypothetical protein ACFFA4_05950 [Promethearchaeota archaeon]